MTKVRIVYDASSMARNNIRSLNECLHHDPVILPDRVPFGMVCCPFLLGVTIKFHLQKEGTPLALHILGNTYVDNVLMGIDSLKETCGVYEEAKSIFKRASMNLREWDSNCLEFLESLPDGERSAVGDTTNLLGL